MELKLVIKGRCPSKKNSKRVICKGDRPRLLSSENYIAWQKEQSYLIKKYRHIKGGNPIDNCATEITIYFPDKRKADLTNKAESVMDLLVDNSIIKDDSWLICHDITLSGRLDKANPRAEITIKYLL